MLSVVAGLHEISVNPAGIDGKFKASPLQMIVLANVAVGNGFTVTAQVAVFTQLLSFLKVAV